MDDRVPGPNRERQVHMTDNNVPEVRTAQNVPERKRRTSAFQATRLVWLAYGILETLILLRIVLKALGADAAAPVPFFVYGFTDLFLLSFKGSTGTPAAGGKVLEISSLIAAVIYALIAYVWTIMIRRIFSRPRGPGGGFPQATPTDQHSHI
jgi:hypothetical protein